MLVTGYDLREALKRWTLRKDTASRQFNNTIFAFDDENKPSPTSVAQDFTKADCAVALLQEAQQRYNLAVQITVKGQSMSLAMAVKSIGGAGRLEKMWRFATTDTGRDRYSIRETTRRADDIVARRVISPEECMEKADAAARFASALRSAVASANGNKLPIEQLSSVTNELKTLIFED